MGNPLRVHRSLTIKQMATVSSVVLVVVCIFIITQLFHFVDQRRTEYAQQMENIAHTIRQPLSEAVLRGNITDAERLLNSLKPAGVLGKAEINLPDTFQALQVDFTDDNIVPPLFAKLFNLPVTISLPLYSPEHTGLPKPLAYLVLEADSTRVYQFVRSTIATMVITYLLLALVLSIAISWFINRLMVYPLRHVARSLQQLPHSGEGAEIPLPEGHRGDEIGALVRGINHRQRRSAAVYNGLEQASTYDAVTKLPNQTLFLGIVEQQLKSFSQGVALMVVKVDALDDLLSSEKRRETKRVLAEKMVQLVDNHTLVGQISDNQFILFFQYYRQPLPLMREAERYIEEFTKPLYLDQLVLQAQVSIGIAFSSPVNVSAQTLFESGLAAMHSAVQQGKNKALFFDPEMTTKSHQRLQQIKEILRGIQDKQYALFLQPQVDMKTGVLSGAEALLRVCRDDGRYSLPANFITTAEEIGVMPEIGRWVFEEACRILANWQSQAIYLPLSVNISAVQLRDSTTIEFLHQLLVHYHIKPGTFVLELTETAQVSDTEWVMNILRPIEQAGVSVVLDDFGMGYSNLHYLHQFRSLPVRRIKLDRSFVSDLPVDDAMVRVIASISEIIGLDVVAEGVETEIQREWLLERGIHTAQGYLFSPAIPEEQFNEQWLSRWSPHDEAHGAFSSS